MNFLNKNYEHIKTNKCYVSKTILILILLISCIGFAQNGINYKALIKDDLGNVLVSQTINVKFTIIADAGPTDVYTETHTGVLTDAKGIIVLNIGEGTTVDVFTDIIWSSDTHSLKTEIDTEQDSTFEFMSTTQFMAVPYALNAGATSIDGLSDGKTYDNGRSLFLGINAGANDDGTIGNNNVGVGYQALVNNTTGFDNTANGYQTLYSNINGDTNVAYGSSALYSNTSGSGNTANGAIALYQNTTGYLNSANGAAALYSNISGYWNTANGYQALFSNIAGSENVALGYQAGFFETGSNKLYIANSNTNTPLIYGDFDTEILTINGDLQVTGNNNLITGLEALDEGNGIGWRLQGRDQPLNSIGYQSVDLSNTNVFPPGNIGATGTNSVALGFRTLASGDKSTAMGFDTTASGERSTAMGYFTTAPSYAETAIGSSNTTYIPNQTTSWDAADRLFVVGNGINNGNLSDALIILKNGNTTINGKTTVNESTNSSTVHALSGIKTHTENRDAYGVYGENTVADFYGYGVYGRGGYMGVRGQVNPTGTSSYFGVYGSVSGGSGINYGVYGSASGGGTNYAVYAAGDLKYTGTLSGPSDRKLKTNINTLNNGMTTIMSLKPSTYSFKENYQKSMHVSNKPQFGFISQELQTVLPDLVSENKHPGANKEDQEISYLGINYIGLIPILTAGIQEQQVHIKTLEDKIELQNQTIQSLISRLEALENR